MPITQSITAFSTPAPARSMDEDAFVAAADAFASQLTNLANTELPALISQMNLNALDASAYAYNAAASASQASVSAYDAAIAAAQATAATAVPKWVSGTTYGSGSNSVAWSPITFQNYRLKVNSLTSTVDPSTDTTNWEQLTIAGNGSNLLTGTNKLRVGNGTGTANKVWFGQGASEFAAVNYNDTSGALEIGTPAGRSYPVQVYTDGVLRTQVAGNAMYCGPATGAYEFTINVGNSPDSHSPTTVPSAINIGGAARFRVIAERNGANTFNNSYLSLDVHQGGVFSGEAARFYWDKTFTANGLIKADYGQIKFPASQNASADANTFDDYEEGTFTPTINFSGGAAGITYTSQTGEYTKKGREVSFSLYVQMASKGSSVGNLAVGGLPFTSNAGAGTYHSCSFHIDPTAAGIASHVSGYILNSSTQVLAIATSAAAGQPLTDATCANATGLIISGTYII